MLRPLAAFTLLGALAVVSGCARKAPGPEECRSFALSAFGLRDEQDLTGALRRGLGLRDQVDELTRECLVLPYDRTLLRCSEETGRLRACRTAFELRRSRR